MRVRAAERRLPWQANRPNLGLVSVDHGFAEKWPVDVVVVRHLVDIGGVVNVT